MRAQFPTYARHGQLLLSGGYDLEAVMKSLIAMVDEVGRADDARRPQSMLSQRVLSGDHRQMSHEDSLWRGARREGTA